MILKDFPIYSLCRTSSQGKIQADSCQSPERMNFFLQKLAKKCSGGSRHSSSVSVHQYPIKEENLNVLKEQHSSLILDHTALTIFVSDCVESFNCVESFKGDHILQAEEIWFLNNNSS